MAHTEERPIGRSPFHLKAEGLLDEALEGYVDEYATALEGEDGFLAEIAFEQMFDISLLQLFKERRAFQHRRDIFVELEFKLSEILKIRNAYNAQSFHKSFDECRGKLSSRGRGITPFSVKPEALLKVSERSSRYDSS